MPYQPRSGVSHLTDGMFTDPHPASDSAQGSGELNGRLGTGSSFFTGPTAIPRVKTQCFAGEVG